MQTIHKVSVVQQAADQIKEYIFSNNLQVGQKLPSEKVLCEQLGIGRGSVREALRVLSSTGYVIQQPGRGAFVMRTEEPNYDQDVITWFENNEVQINDYLEVRAVVEPLAAKLAVARCTDADYTKLEEIHHRYKEAMDANDFDAILREETNFHNTIIQMSGNELLINIFKLIQKPAMNFRYWSLSLPNAPMEGFKPHSQILRAFDLRDPEYGEACMRNHVTLGIKNLNLSKESFRKLAESSVASIPEH